MNKDIYGRTFNFFKTISIILAIIFGNCYVLCEENVTGMLLCNAFMKVKIRFEICYQYKVTFTSSALGTLFRLFTHIMSKAKTFCNATGFHE